MSEAAPIVSKFSIMSSISKSKHSVSGKLTRNGLSVMRHGQDSRDPLAILRILDSLWAKLLTIKNEMYHIFSRIVSVVIFSQ